MITKLRRKIRKKLKKTKRGGKYGRIFDYLKKPNPNEKIIYTKI
jgi:hypothetical protein